MIPAPRHDLIPGEPISVGDLRDFYANVESLGNFSADAPLNLQRGPGGYHLRLDLDELASLIGVLIEIENLTVNNFFLTVDGTFTWEGHGEFTPRDVVTNVCPTNLAKEKAATAATTGVNSTTWTDLTGSSLTFTVVKSTDVQIVATWDIAGNGNAVADDRYSGALNIDGTRETLLGTMTMYGANARATVSQSYVVTLGAGSHTIKLQGQRTSGTGSADFEVNSGWTLLASPVITVSIATGIAIAPEVCEDNPADCCPDTWWCITPVEGAAYCFQGTEQEAYTEADDGTVAGPYTLEADCTFVCESAWWCITPAVGDIYCFNGTESEADTEAGAGSYAGPHASEAACLAVCTPPISTACGTVNATIYGTVDTFSCFSGEISLTYNASGANGARWYSPTYTCSGKNLYFTMRCNAGSWEWEEFCDGVSASTGSVTVSDYDPFTATLSWPSSGTCSDSPSATGSLRATP